MAQLFGLARLGRDAEIRRTTSNDPVATLSLAFNYGRKGEDGRRPTQWVEAALWGARAEALVDYLTKGTAVSITVSDVHIETFERADTTQGHKLVGRVAEIELAGSPQGASAPPPPAPARQAPPPRATAARAPAPASRGSTGFDDMDDDIPF